MAKPRVERAPQFDITKVSISDIAEFITQYNATDEKGRYLHWDQLKWRVPTKDAEKIWLAIKFKRSFQSKFINLTDEKGRRFHYNIPHSMEAKLHEIVKVAGGNVGATADGVASDSIQKKFLVSSLIMEEAITSAQLEGASTTREVAKKMLEEEREPVDEDERMIINNYLLLKYAEKIAHENLTIDLILNFHRIATLNTTENNVIPGVFREDDDIYVEDDRGEIAHQPPSFVHIKDRLLKLCEFANEEHNGKSGQEFIPPVIKAIILHFMIGYEHPFRDGNGRTARALFYWYMLKNDYNLFKYISISKLLREDPKGYGLSYMYTEKDDSDLTYFIDFQLDIILQAFEELKKYLKQKTDDFYQVVALLEHSSINDKLNFIQKDLLKKGMKNPGSIFTAKGVANTYSVTENTARTHLNNLVDMKLLLPTKDGRTVLYIVPSDLKERIKV
ncbi:Fic family protein [Aeromonas caviae]|uniref:Fic family protein n=1 Tax=Aeromonas caviae TaxID=648 RepID=UPI001FC83495|nr:Fic family protein [Aeromonas caviae]GKR31049.1 Fic family protein [Aeromonas caviae]